MKTKSIGAWIFFFGLLSGNVSAFIYDDFSGAVLNSSKWFVTSPAESSCSLSEFYLDTVNKNYHTSQITPSDCDVNLKVDDHIFYNGDSLDYDVILNSGEGNYMSRLVINGIRLDVSLACPWCGAIGYWGQPMAEGNMTGANHIRIEFQHQNTSIKFTRPDKTYTLRTSTISSPFTFSFETRTGHNGITHVDYDNFVINQKCGDANSDDVISLSDVVFLANYIFKNVQKPLVFAAADVNSDGRITLSDVIYLVNYILKNGPAPACTF